ncbi:UNVERIFIED_ORG: hypothetical protein BCL66_109114 [Martelella mediterranea]
MISFVKRAYDNFFGAGEAAVTVPPMDGALMPNDALDRADSIADITAPDNLVFHDGAFLFSSGAVLYRLAAKGGSEPVETFGGEILALASDGAGTLAVAVSGEGIALRGGALDGRTVGSDIDGLTAVTALCFDGASTLYVAVGSTIDTADNWVRNLMSLRADGAVWCIEAGAAARKIAGNLAWPAGLAMLDDGRLAVSEAWRHRIDTLTPDGKKQTIVSGLPAYPGRLTHVGGKIWLCLFAPRRQLVEFVLREKEFRTTMMREIPQDLWMAPALRSGESFREPLQGGAVKQLGVLKAWAPTRSYGLLVRFAENFTPEASYHSRADGRRHGITSVIADADRVFVTSKGGDAVLALSTDTKAGR